MHSCNITMFFFVSYKTAKSTALDLNEETGDFEATSWAPVLSQQLQAWLATLSQMPVSWWRQDYLFSWLLFWQPLSIGRLFLYINMCIYADKDEINRLQSIAPLKPCHRVGLHVVLRFCKGLNSFSVSALKCAEVQWGRCFEKPRPAFTFLWVQIPVADDALNAKLEV